jgi:peptidyl-prolyl cis-trans isomerase SurA
VIPKKTLSLLAVLLAAPAAGAPAAAAPAPAAAAAPAASATPAPAGEVVDRVAATVDGDVVTLSEIEERAASELRRADGLPPGKERDQAHDQAIRRAFDTIVYEKLLEKQAKALQLEVTDTQVDAAIEDIKTRNHFDDAQLDRALDGQGLDRKTFRAQIRRELESYQVMQSKVRGRVKVTDDDLKNYYQTHPQEFGGETELHVRHIFMPLPEHAPKAEQARAHADAERVLQRLKTGEDFATVAKQVSQGPSAADGGDLGWLRRGTIQKALEDAAFGLKDGQVSGIVQAGPGLHIVKVEERRIGGARSFEDAKEEIRNRLLDEQVTATRQQLLDELRKAAVVEVKLPELK